MVEQPKTSIPIGVDEKSAQVMAYTTNALVWGDVVVKSFIRVSTWLRTNAAPDRILLYNARLLPAANGGVVKPLHFAEIDLAVPSLLAFHLAPPAEDPLDYDPTEPNRIMEPVAAVVGPFLFRGKLRMSANLDLKHHLDVVRETFSALYDVQISHLQLPNLGPIQCPYALVRQDRAIFGHG